VQNALGLAYYQQNQSQMALDHHLQALRLVKNKEARDMSLRLSIYRNLANDYWAVSDLPRAISMYQEALDVLDGMNDLPHQAEIFWQLAMAYRAKSDWTNAKLYATRALHIFEAADNSTEAAAITMSLAELLTGDNKLGEAAVLLKKAENLLAITGDASLKSALYHSYAEIARQQGNLDDASQYADMSIKLSDQLVRQAQKGGKQARTSALRTHAQALHEAALIEERRHNAAEADRLFLEALKAIQQTGIDEAAYEINFSYAQVLEARDDHKQAMEYYRKAAELHARPART
jgi:tetratricopeptide (TPR) repeat protein